MSDARRDIAAQRLRNQRLDGPPLESVADVVRWFGGMQFQEYPVARWSIGQRAIGMTEPVVDQAVEDATVVRTHVLRDTWHLVTANDLRWLMALTGPRIQARNATMYRRLDLNPALLARTNDLLVGALGGTRLPRRDIAALLERHGIAAAGLPPRLHPHACGARARHLQRRAAGQAADVRAGGRPGSLDGQLVS